MTKENFTVDIEVTPIASDEVLKSVAKEVEIKDPEDADEIINDAINTTETEDN